MCEEEEPYRVCFHSLFISHHHHFYSWLLCSNSYLLFSCFTFQRGSHEGEKNDLTSPQGSQRCAAHSFTCPRSPFFPFVSPLRVLLPVLAEQAAGCLVNWTGRSVLLTYSLPLSERSVMGAPFLKATRALSGPRL